MSHHHERQVCRCGAVVMQCRCMAPKTDRVVCETCPKCQRATAAAPISTASATPAAEPPTFKSTLRALYDRRSTLFTAERLDKATAEDAAEAASIEAQIDVLELAEAIVQGTFDRAAEAEGKFRDVANGLLEAARGHEKAISGASMAALEVMVAGLPAKTAPQDSTPQGTAGAVDAPATTGSTAAAESQRASVGLDPEGSAAAPVVPVIDLMAALKEALAKKPATPAVPRYEPEGEGGLP